MKMLSILFIISILCYVLLIQTNQSVELSSQSLTYESEEVDCHWLDAEYNRIKTWSKKGETQKKVTPEGLVMTALTLVTAPLAWLTDVLGEDIEYNFSDNPDDIVVAAEQKECYDLLEIIQQDQADGTYPLPLEQPQ